MSAHHYVTGPTLTNLTLMLEVEYAAADDMVVVHGKARLSIPVRRRRFGRLNTSG